MRGRCSLFTLSSALGLALGSSACESLPHIEVSGEMPDGPNSAEWSDGRLDVATGAARLQTRELGRSSLILEGADAACDRGEKVVLAIEQPHWIERGTTYDIQGNEDLFIVASVRGSGFGFCDQSSSHGAANKPCDGISGTLRLDHIDSASASGTIDIVATHRAAGDDGRSYVRTLAFHWEEFAAPSSHDGVLNCPADG